MIVIGIDPGSIHCGWGIVETSGGRTKRIDSGRISLPKSEPLSVRLMKLQQALAEIMSQCSPDAAAVEKIFFAKSIQSALALGHARGVVLASLAARGMAIHEYSPLEVKQSVVGYGKASKKQVQEMVTAILGLAALPEEDEADALAIAVCHAHGHGLKSRIAQAEGARR